MRLRVLIIPDKFKGTLNAVAAAEAIACGWRQVRPGDHLELLPMSDGGDGFGEVMGKLLRARIQRTETIDAAHRLCRAPWWWEPKSSTAVIESALVVGLAMLPRGHFHPFELDTSGLAGVLRAAATRGAAAFLIGIGGSATNDGGFGLARALGWTFCDRRGATIERWTDLRALAQVRPPVDGHRFGGVRVAVDVQNPLLGPRGATRVYGPQKGLTAEDYPQAEAALRKLASVVKRELGDFGRQPGAGAAGGLGFGLLAFLSAKMESGFELFARYAGLDRRLRSADLVVTGEGAIDRSTLMGKGVGEIARRCAKWSVPCIGLAGTVDAGRDGTRTFTRLRALTELTSANQAKAEPAYWLESLARRMAQEQASD